MPKFIAVYELILLTVINFLVDHFVSYALSCWSDSAVPCRTTMFHLHLARDPVGGRIKSAKHLYVSQTMTRHHTVRGG